MDDIENSEQHGHIGFEAQVMAMKNSTVANWRDDSETLALFIQMILSNGRLSSAIVDAWQIHYHKVMVDEPTPPT